MTLYPAPTAFPLPTGGFPRPPALSDPAFGMNPYQPGNMYLTGLFAGNSQAIAARASRQAQLMQSAQVATANAVMGGTLESDPRQWTPEQAAEQTDRALAKLSTVNPDLAKQLAAQRTGEDTGGSFWDNIGSALGTILKPGLEIGGRLLEVLSRTSHIVPNLAFDLFDGGGVDPMGDIGGAIAGTMNHNWNAVFQEAGWEGGGIGGIARAMLGLGFDVATDPLTWLIPAGAGKKFAEVAGIAAKDLSGRTVAEFVTDAAVRMTPEELEKAGLTKIAEFVNGRTAAEVGTDLATHHDVVTGALKASGKYIGADIDTRAAAMVDHVYQTGEVELYKLFWEVADTSSNLLAGRGLRAALREGIFLDGGKHIPATQYKAMVEKIIKEGAGKAYNSTEWRVARAFASMAGGTRLKLAIPHTAFRYISGPLMPLTRFTPNAMGSKFAQFFAGHSAVTGIVHEIGEGRATSKLLGDYLERGWFGTKDLPGIAKMPEWAESVALLKGRGRNLGSAHYSLSEKIGGITAHLDQAARSARTGLVGVWTYNAEVEARNLRASIVRDIVAHTDPGAVARLETMGISSNVRKHVASRELERGVVENVDYFPVGLDLKDPAAIEAWYRETRPDFVLLEQQTTAPLLMSPPQFGPYPEADALLAAHHQRLELMQESAIGYRDADGALIPWTEKELGTIDSFRQRFDYGADLAAEHESSIGRQNLALKDAPGIHPEQVGVWQGQSGNLHPSLRGTTEVEGEPGVFWISAPDAQARQELKNRGIGPSHSSYGSGSQGVVVTSKKLHPDDQAVVLRGQDVIDLDSSRNAQLQAGLEGGDVTRTVEDVRVRVDEEVRTLELDGVLPIIDEKATRRKVDELMGEAMKADRPFAVGTRQELSEGVQALTIWDPANVKLVGTEYSIVEKSGGHLPRILSKRVKTWVNGIIPRDETQILLSVPELQMTIERSTAGKTLRESEDIVREKLAKLYPQGNIDDLAGVDMWEMNLAEVDSTHIIRLANDVADQQLGRFALRQARQSRLAPFMYGGVPRTQEYELDVSSGLLKALAAKDIKLKDLVTKLKLREKAYLEKAHAAHARGIEATAEFAALLDEELAGASTHGLPTKELEHILKWGTYADDAVRKLDGERAAAAKGHELLDEETLAYDLSQEEYLLAQGKAKRDEAAAKVADEAAKAADEAAKAAPTSKLEVLTTEEAKARAVFVDRDIKSKAADKAANDFRAKLDLKDDKVTSADLAKLEKLESLAAKAEKLYETASTRHSRAFAAKLKAEQEAAAEVAGAAAKAELAGPREFVTSAAGETEVKRVVYEGARIVEEYDVREARNELFNGAPYAADGPTGVERIDYQASTGVPMGNLDAVGLPPAEDGYVVHITEETSGIAIQAEGVTPHSLYDQSNMPRGQGVAPSVPESYWADTPERARQLLVGKKIERPVIFRTKLENVRPRTAGNILREGEFVAGESLTPDLLEVWSPDGRWLPADANPAVAGGRATLDDQAFEALVESGQVHLRTDPTTRARSIFKKDGTLITSATGGKQLRPRYQINLDRTDLNAAVARLDEAEAALKTGGRYEAPAEAQVGARLPGEHRTPTQAALFAAQKATSSLGGVGKAHRASTKEAAEVGRVLGRMRSQLHDVANAVNKAYAEATGARAALKPALVKVDTEGSLTGLTRLRIPGFEGLAMPSFMADELHAAIDQFGPKAISRNWRQFVLGPWKRWATYRWPGFHVRNAFGAWFNNFLGGVSVSDYQFAWRVNNYGLKKDWHKKFVNDAEWARYNLDGAFGPLNKGKVTYGQVKQLLSAHGVGSANTRAVLESANTADELRGGLDALAKGDKTGFRGRLHATDQHMMNAGAMVEDFHRTAAWATGMGNLGGDVWGARSFVMLRHGDYAELTQFEDHIRDLIPFYKWMRTNIPYQFRMLAENPAGTLLIADKVKATAYDIAGVDQTQAEIGQPNFMKQTLALPIPSWMPKFLGGGEDGIKYLMADMPYNDLYNGLNDYISASLPIVRNLFESYGFHTQAFTGKPLDNSMVKLSGAFGATWIGELLSHAPGTGVTKGADGSYYINDRLENVLTAIPIYSRFRNFLEADTARVEQRMGGVFSMIAGLGIREADATQAELDFYYNEVEPLLDQYRDMGVTFPNAQDFIQGANAVAPRLPDFAATA